MTHDRLFGRAAWGFTLVILTLGSCGQKAQVLEPGLDENPECPMKEFFPIEDSAGNPLVLKMIASARCPQGETRWCHNHKDEVAQTGLRRGNGPLFHHVSWGDSISTYWNSQGLVIGFGEGWESYGIDPIRWLVLPCSTRRGSLHEFSSGQINLFPFSVNFRMEITATSSETVTIQEIFTQDRESTHVEHSGELILKLGKGPVRFSGQTFEWFGGELKTDQQVWVEFENITGRPFDPRIETF
ncbi:MAG: hypothetical protein HYT87_02355 [Nitrospirae bacterium]|nr:hypothetical protein [Nitrospirota bacterium]